jgi:hypothetical protein
MLLGDLLAEIERENAAGNSIALLDDLVLAARVSEAAARRGMQAEAYIMAAVRRFEREASNEDWTTLISAITGSTNPGSACLRGMVERELKMEKRPKQNAC